MVKPKVAIVIPHHKGAEIISDTISSLLNQTYSNYRIILVNNASSDGTTKIVSEKFPTVIIINLPNNKGFAGGVNTGIKYALANKFKYVALFNNDAKADKDWLKFLVNSMENDSSIGITTSKILFDDKKTIDSTGDFMSFYGFSSPRGRGEIDNGQYDLETNIQSASGGASIYRLKMLEQIGLFDEDFFAYYEDVDISLRANNNDWKIVFQPFAIAYHKVGYSSSQIPGFVTYQFFKNTPLVIFKNYRGLKLIATTPLFISFYILLLIKNLFSDKRKYALSGFIASIRILLGISTPNDKALTG